MQLRLVAPVRAYELFSQVFSTLATQHNAIEPQPSDHCHSTSMRPHHSIYSSKIGSRFHQLNHTHYELTPKRQVRA